MEVKDLLTIISKKTGKTEEVLKTELDKIFDDIDDSIKEDDRKIMATNKLRSSYRKQLASKGKQYKIIPIADANTFDMVGKARKQAIEEAAANPIIAEQQNLLNEKGDPLYNTTQQKFNDMTDWQMDQRFEQHEKGHLQDAAGKLYRGKKMPEHDYNKTVIVAVQTDKGWEPCALRIRGNNTFVKLPTDFGVYTIVGYEPKSSEEGNRLLNDNRELKFKPTGEKLSEEKIISLLENEFSEHAMLLDDMIQWCQDNTDFNRFAIMKVMVSEIIPNDEGKSWQIIKVEDDSMGFEDENGDIVQPITVFLPGDKEITFPERSEVYLIGQPNVNDKGKSIGGMGFYVPAMYRDMIESQDEE